MKKSKLLVLSLLAVSAIGLTSCGQAGPQGEKGDPGAPGEKGEAGAAGQDGTDGTDGKSVLNGEGAPKDTLGVDGDSYIDYSSFDYYVKENGKWVKKGNIKGAKGDDGEQGPKGDAGSKGEKGDTGSTGSTGARGPQGATAWSNTILPSDDGYITVNKGSALENEQVTFTINANGTNALKAFYLNGKAVDNSKIKELPVTNGHLSYTCTVNMQKYGYVVNAEYDKNAVEAIGEGGYLTKTGSNADAVYTIHPSEGYIFTTLKFGDNGTGVVTESKEDGTYEYKPGTIVSGSPLLSFMKESELKENNYVINQETGAFSSTLLDAIPNLQNGKLRLVKDLDAAAGYKEEYLSINNNTIIIDLNGHKLSSSLPFNLGVGVSKFAITGYGEVESNKAKASDLKITSNMGTDSQEETKEESTGALNIYTGSTADNTTLVPEIKIGSGVSISTDREYGIRVANKTRELDLTKNPVEVVEKDADVKVKLDVEGSVEVNSNSTESAAIKVEGGQTASSNITVNVAKGAEITNKNGQGIEIHSGELTLNGKVEAQTALKASIDAKSGNTIKVNVNKTATVTGSVDVKDGVTYTVEEGSTITGDEVEIIQVSTEGRVTFSESESEKGKFVYKVEPTTGYVPTSITVDKKQYTDLVKSDDEKSYSLTLDSKPSDIYSAKTAYVQPTTTTQVINKTNGQVYNDFVSAMTSVNSCTDKSADLMLWNDAKLELSQRTYYCNKGKISVDLNNHDLDICDTGFYVINYALEIKGKGEVRGNDVLFRLVGGFTYSETSYKGTETSLTIGKDVKTISKTDDAISIDNYNSCYDICKLTDHGTASSTNKVTLNYQGTDESKLGIVYVNGDIAKAEGKTPIINIEGASSTGKSYIAGYCDLTVKDSTFNTSGSAFNIKSGKINFENNKFTNDLAGISIKTPYYVGDSDGALNGNATIWLQDNVKGYAGIDSATFKNNTFTYQNEDGKVDSYYNVGLFGDNSENAANKNKTIVTPSFLDESGAVVEESKYIAYKYSDMKYMKTFTYSDDKGAQKTLTAYFLEASDAAQNYSADDLLKEFNASSSAFINLTAGTGSKINNEQE